MAKISARGATKLAEAIANDVSPDWPGNVARTFYVLRSDGGVLRATSFPNHPGGSYDRQRSGYKLLGKAPVAIIAEGREALVAWFDRFAARKGAVVA